MEVTRREMECLDSLLGLPKCGVQLLIHSKVEGVRSKLLEVQQLDIARNRHMEINLEALDM